MTSGNWLVIRVVTSPTSFITSPSRKRRASAELRYHRQGAQRLVHAPRAVLDALCGHDAPLGYLEAYMLQVSIPGSGGDLWLNPLRSSGVPRPASPPSSLRSASPYPAASWSGQPPAARPAAAARGTLRCCTAPTSAGPEPWEARR